MSFVDANGDGLPDLVVTRGFYDGGDPISSSFSFPPRGAYQNAQLFINGMGKADKLKTIINSTGSTIALDYAVFGNEGIQNPKAVWALSEVRTVDGVLAPTKYDDHQNILIDKIAYSQGVYDRAERQFLGFAQIIDEKRGCAADPDLSKKLTNVALSAACKSDASEFLRRAVRTFDTQSIYTSGLILDEINTDKDSNVIDVTSYAYGLSPAPDDEHRTKHLLQPFKACGVDGSLLDMNALDDVCLQTYRNHLKNDIDTTWQVNAVDELRNTANAGRWSVLHLSPNLKLVRKNILEGGPKKLRSMALFDQDDVGNVVAMVDFGHIRNPGDFGE